MAGASSNSWRHSNIPAQAESAKSCSILFTALRLMFGFAAIFSAHDKENMKVNLRLRNSLHDHFVQHRSLWMTIDDDYRKEPRIDEGSYMYATFADDGKVEMLNSDVLYHVDINCQDGSESLETYSAPSLPGVWFSLVRNIDSLSVGSQRIVFYSVLCMICFTNATAAVSIQCQKPCTGISRATLRLTSRGLITTDFQK